jgi:hypothetical protein
MNESLLLKLLTYEGPNKLFVVTLLHKNLFEKENDEEDPFMDTMFCIVAGCKGADGS